MAGLAIGIGAAVALTSMGDAMNREVMHAMDEFGANILVLPDSEELPLDSKTGDEVLNMLERLHADGHTIVMVTHSSENAKRAGRIIEIRDGTIV